jgi:hypothetical protein
MTSTDPYVFPSATTPNTNPCSKIPPGLLTYRHDPADRGDPCQPIDQGAQLADSKNFRAAGSGGHPAHYSTIPLQAVLAFAFAESHTPLITHSRPAHRSGSSVSRQQENLTPPATARLNAVPFLSLVPSVGLHQAGDNLAPHSIGCLLITAPFPCRRS